MRPFERDGSYAAVDDAEAGTRRALIGDVDRRSFKHRHRDGNREHRIGRERRNRRWRGRLSALREQNRWDYDNKQTDTNRERHRHGASGDELARRL
jgi:hypothetical protein